MLDPKGIMNFRTKQMNLLKMHEIDFRRVMEICRKFESGSAVSDEEIGLYDRAMDILKKRNLVDYFLERFSKDNRARLQDRAGQEEKTLVEDLEEEEEEPAGEKLDTAARFNLAMTRLDQRECTWLVDVLDKFLKTNRKMDNRISLVFKYVEKQKNGVAGHVLFLAWSNCKLALPVLIGKRSNMLFIQGKGFEVVFDSEGRINVLDTSCLAALTDSPQKSART